MERENSPRYRIRKRPDERSHSHRIGRSHARYFHSNGRRPNRTQTAYRDWCRSVRRSCESVRKLNLHQVCQAPAPLGERPLLIFPHNRRTRTARWRGRRRRLLIVISARCANFARRRNVQAHEYRISIGISESGAIVVGGIRIVVARHHDSVSEALQFRAKRSSELQDQILLRDAGSSARARVRAAVPWIEHNHGSQMHRGRGRSLRWRYLLGWWN